MSQAPSIVWFQHTLRLEDNEAVAAAVGLGTPVIPVFVWNAGEPDGWPVSPRRRAWISASLRALDRRLRSVGSRLIIRSGDPAEAIAALCLETSAQALYLNRSFDPFGRDIGDRVRRAVGQLGVEWHEFNGSLLFDPQAVRNRSGTPFQVFTPFWKHLLTLNDPGSVPATPQRLPAPSVWPDGLEGSLVHADGLPREWEPGEDGARRRLERFLDQAAAAYADNRDRPDLTGTSRLSPHLAHGEISPRRIWREVSSRLPSREDASASPYLRQIAWREFAAHLLWHFPHTVERPLRPAFEKWPWRHDEAEIRSWQLGQTGYPIVDAGMRELAATGWMHNRVRMVAASFLTKHMLTSWVVGARWFWHALLDADLANNTLGWQWVAGCGADAAPYFRVFNPVLQGKKFDPEGGYVRRWVPELAGLGEKHIHEPWNAPADALARAGVKIGEHYPQRLVQHHIGRDRALQTYERMRRGIPRAVES